MTNSRKGFGKKSLLNNPTTQIFKTSKSFINDCFELAIFCVGNNLIDIDEMMDFATQFDGDQLGDNNETEAKIKSLISGGCDPRAAYKLGVILTYLEIPKLTDQINKKLDRRKQSEFDTARMIAVVLDYFMRHYEYLEDDCLDDDLSNNLNNSTIDIDLIIITRLKKAILTFD